MTTPKRIIRLGYLRVLGRLIVGLLHPGYPSVRRLGHSGEFVRIQGLNSLSRLGRVGCGEYHWSLHEKRWRAFHSANPYARRGFDGPNDELGKGKSWLTFEPMRCEREFRIRFDLFRFDQVESMQAPGRDVRGRRGWFDSPSRSSPRRVGFPRYRALMAVPDELRLSSPGVRRGNSPSDSPSCGAQLPRHGRRLPVQPGSDAEAAADVECGKPVQPRAWIVGGSHAGRISPPRPRFVVRLFSSVD